MSDERQDEAEQQDETGRQDQPILDPLSPEDALLRQFPALHGQEDVETAERSTDVDEPSTNVHRKVFVLLRSDYGRGFDHGPNLRATIQFMIQNGLRPLGEARFDAAKKLDDGKSVALAYTVEAVPAVVAEGDPAHVVVE